MMKFNELSDFVEYLGKLPRSVRVATQRSLEAGAEILEGEAIDIIGTYQRSGLGPFAAWEELAQSTKEQRARLGYSDNDPGLRSGAMRDSITHRVGIGEAVIGSNDQHLVWFELGTVHQSPRSVLGIAGYRKAPEVATLIGKQVARAVAGLIIIT